jgi:chromosome segregation ATPase
MSERPSGPSVPKPVPKPREGAGAREDLDRADPAFVAKLQQAATLANENCDRAMALAHKLSAELNAAQRRINQLEREADGLYDRLRAEAETAVAKLQSDADMRVHKAKRELDERVAGAVAEADKRMIRARDELAQAQQAAARAKAEAETRVRDAQAEAQEEVAHAQAEANARLDRMRADFEEQLALLKADLAQSNNRAERAEHWLGQIRQEIEGRLMPSLASTRDRLPQR